MVDLECVTARCPWTAAGRDCWVSAISQFQQYTVSFKRFPPVTAFRMYTELTINSVQLNFSVTAENPESLTQGSLFFCPRNPGDPEFRDGPLIVKNDGEVIWDGTAEPFNFDQSMVFEPSLYMGQNVLALWQGTFFGGGYGDGYGLILNTSYHVIANVCVSQPDYPPSISA